MLKKKHFNTLTIINNLIEMLNKYDNYKEIKIVKKYACLFYN